MAQSFILFRLKLVRRSNQSAFFEVNRGLVLRKILAAKPGYTVRVGHYWAFGNVEELRNESIVFKLGRKVSKEDPVYDEVSRDFILGDVELSDCVDAYYNPQYQLLAIENKSGLPEPWTLANYATKIINFAWKEFSENLSPEEFLSMKDLQAEYGTIRDHRDFVKLIDEAYKLKRLTVAFSRPNAFTPQDFRRPLEKHTEQLRASKGSATFYAQDDLDRDIAIATAKDASAAGQAVSARIVENEDTSARTIKMEDRTHPLIVDVEEPESKSDILVKIVNAFKPLLKVGK